jgi:parvulin-like peptidyl-prolyl isomerase
MIGRTWKAGGLAGALVLGWWLDGASAQPGTTPSQPPPPAGQAAATAVKPAAVVNGVPISMAELEQVLKQAGPFPVEVPVSQHKMMQMEVLSILIDNMLLEQFLKGTGVQVPTGEVEKKIAELSEGMKKQNKTLADFLRESSQTEAQLRADLANRVAWQTYAKAKMTDADVERYFKDNKDFFDGVAVHACHIVLRVPPTAPQSELLKAQTQLAGLRAQILENKIEFSDAAKKYSQCLSAPNGGDIGFFPRKGYVEEAFAKVAFAMPVGQVSDVVQTDYGLHLIKVLERKPGTPSDYTKIKEAVHEIAMEEMKQLVLSQLKKKSKIEINLQ